MAGRKINDYGGWAHTSDMQMKTGNKLMSHSSAEGAGAMPDYPDTTEDIKRDQVAGIGKMKSQKMKSGYRY